MVSTERFPTAISDHSSPAPAQPQVLLGRYRILGTNAEGGFGCVHVCWDARLQRRVAIKQMPLTLGDAGVAPAVSTVDEALAEARTSSMLAHPNIVTMFDFETDDYNSYLVMEYVDGLNLAELLARVEDGVLSFDECAHVVESVSAALAYAHENGVLHLDIKPANIMVDRSGVVKLADFGMASLASAAGYGGARGGTVGYMPPEQIEGGFVDERTDVFAVAVVVWQALTGVCPYAADTAEKSLALIERGPSPTLSHIEPDLAGIVENTLLRALTPNPTARTASVEEFCRDLAAPLGDAEEGRESLADLLNQTEEDEEPSLLEEWDRLSVPLPVSHPWLASAVRRVLAAGCAAWMAYAALPYAFPATNKALQLGAAGVALACAVWPPLSGAAGVACVAAALMAQGSRWAIPLGLAVGLVGAGWWLLAGRDSHLSGPALLFAACASSPFAGVGLAGYALEPAGAALTGAGGWLFALLVRACAQNAFEAEAVVSGVATELLHPAAWALGAGCALAALLCSAITGRGGVVAGATGQMVGVGVLCAACALAGRMENDSIAAALDIPALVVALILGVALSIATALAGQGRYQPEG